MNSAVAANSLVRILLHALELDTLALYSNQSTDIVDQTSAVSKDASVVAAVMPPAASLGHQTQLTRRSSPTAAARTDRATASVFGKKATDSSHSVGASGKKGAPPPKSGRR